MTDLNANVNDLDLEYKDVVKDPNDPGMQAIAATIPEKYKDKSREDLIDMHVNIEKVLARQGNEVGQLRKVVDSQTLILNKAIGNPTQTDVKPLPVTAERLLNDPENAVNQVVQQNPAVSGNAQRINNLEMQVAQNKFESANKSWKDDLNDTDFQSWVLGSKIRSKLMMGLNAYNFEAGEELWELWNEHKGAKQASESARQSRVAAVSTVRGGAGEPMAKPTLSRAKLAELQTRAMNGDRAAKAKWEDPEFQRMYQEAYAESRIR